MAMKKTKVSNEQLVKTIESHLTDNLSLETLASYFHYSEYYFSRVFREQMGISVMDYVCKRRLVIASEEILKGKNIIDVAMEFGWQSHNGFAKAFRKEYGFSPSLLKAMMIEIENQGGSAMKHIFLSKTDEHASKEELEKVLKNTMKEKGIEYHEELDKVIQCAEQVYEGVVRHSGDAYITHTLNVAIILAQLETNVDTIEAGLFCDAYKKSVNVFNEIKMQLPEKVNCILKEISETDKLDQLSEEALLVKIAERLHNMRTIEFMDEKKKAVKAKETVDIFMPIARQLGKEQVISELNDLSVKYM